MSPEDGKFPPEVNDRVTRMLLIFTAARVALSIVAVVLTFPGKDFTNDKEVQDIASGRSNSRHASGYIGSIDQQ